jgi:hypothetical protein
MLAGDQIVIHNIVEAPGAALDPFSMLSAAAIETGLWEVSVSGASAQCASLP